jgi:hypothetical protein
VRREAKALLKRHRDGDAAVCSTLRHIPRLAGTSDTVILRASVHLQEVQHALAQVYGFRSWTELRRQLQAAYPTLSPGHQSILQYLRDISDVSQACATTTYIWGGLTPDLLEGRFVREHRGVDGFVVNMLALLPQLSAHYEARGYTVQFRDDFDMLGIWKDGRHATFNHLDIDGETALWRHIGREGTLYFPVEWLDQIPRIFYGVPVYCAGLEFDYVLKTNIRMLHAEWHLREQDQDALAYLQHVLAERHIDPEAFLSKAWSYNPFWVKQGYPEYAMPTVARPLQPIAAKDA